MIINNMMRNLRYNLERMDKSQQSLATGKKFNVPSDDPIGVSRSLRLNTDVSIMEQFKRNADDAQSWMDTTEKTTDSIISVLQRARELTVQAANETNSVDERKAIAQEIKELREQLIDLGNATYAGRYLFSGYKTDKPLLKEDGTYDLGGATLNSAELINLNVGIGDQMGMNFVGQKIFGLVEDPTVDLDANVSTGRYEYNLKATGAFTGYNAVGAQLDISYNGVTPSYQINLDDFNYTTADGVDGIISNINLKISGTALSGHVSASLVDGKISFTSDEALSVAGTPAPAFMNALGITNNSAVKSVYGIRGELIQNLSDNNIEVNATNNSFIMKYNGSEYTINLNQPKTYDGSGAGMTLNDLVADIQDQINDETDLKGHVNVVNQNGRIMFSSDEKVSFKTTVTNAFDISKIGMSDSKAGVPSGQNVKSGEETQLLSVFEQLAIDLESDNTIGIGDALARIDIHVNNINAVRAEIGVKSNRINLTVNRIEDDTINLKGLLSKNEDADMAEVIMKLKAEENVYRASLSGGARIIQPSLVDFLR
jgi:flagellar hook-associated protein 3